MNSKYINTRRDFINKTLKLVFIGFVTRFSILGIPLRAATQGDSCSAWFTSDTCDHNKNPDNCMGGLPTNDNCNNDDPDFCPGEAPEPSGKSAAAVRWSA